MAKTTQQIKFETEFKKLTGFEANSQVEIPDNEVFPVYIPIVRKLNKKFGNGITSPLCISGTQNKSFIEYNKVYFQRNTK